MSWIVDAHYEWHAVHGALAVCPLDCGIGEGYEDEPDEEAMDQWREANRNQR